jgi:hypothetical protein
MQRGANPLLVTKNGKTPLQYSMELKNAPLPNMSEIIELLQTATQRATKEQGSSPDNVTNTSRRL